MLTIRQLAKRAGVSPATVSLALNYKKGVSLALAERIRQLAFDLGYHKGLKSQADERSNFVVTVLQVVKHGHILGVHHQSFIDGYIMGMMQYATQQNRYLQIQLEVKTLHWSRVAGQLRQLGSSQHLGYIVIATELDAVDIRQLAQELPYPLVFIDAIYDHLPYDFIDMNNTDVIYEIVQHLAQQGHRQVSFVGGKQNTPNFYLREVALEAACEEFHVDLKRRYSIDPYDDPDALEMQKLLQKTPPPPALVCANDYIAYNCIKALQVLHYRIPQNVCVVGFDNLPASPLFLPPLSSVEIPKQEMGALALARLLAKLQLLRDADFPYSLKSACKQKLSGQFIPRASSLRAG